MLYVKQEVLTPRSRSDPVEEQGKYHSGDTDASNDCKSSAPFSIGGILKCQTGLTKPQS